ncbi:hypothetical protein RDI58_007461 [Solanum bulbocastanum]|uniref:Uncharacterized protein n=1 Tax=Solanum bulbocastanum TaxID=147425 RepID=A0AAN8YM59_SOLBU
MAFLGMIFPKKKACVDINLPMVILMFRGLGRVTIVSMIYGRNISIIIPLL